MTFMVTTRQKSVTDTCTHTQKMTLNITQRQPSNHKGRKQKKKKEQKRTTKGL